MLRGNPPTTERLLTRTTDLSRAETQFLDLAVRLAAGRQAKGYRLGAVAVRSGRVLGTGVNRHRNDVAVCRILPRASWSVHAEDACLRRIAVTRGANLYIARVSATGKPRMARPCIRCWALCVEAGISKIIYTTNGGSAVERIAG